MMRDGFDIKAFYAEVDRRYAEGRGDEVLDFLVAALDRARTGADPGAFVAVASELGGVLRVRGDHARALGLYDEALRALGRWEGSSPESLGSLLINRGDVLVAAGCHREAIDAFDEAERVIEGSSRDPYQLSAVCNNRSAAYRELGRFDLARRDLGRAVRLLGDDPARRPMRAVTRTGLAQILVKEGRLERAEHEIGIALAEYEELSGGRDIHRPNALATAGQIAYLRGSYRRAAELYRLAAELLEDKVGPSETVALLEREHARMGRLAARGGGDG